MGRFDMVGEGATKKGILAALLCAAAFAGAVMAGCSCDASAVRNPAALGGSSEEEVVEAASDTSRGVTLTNRTGKDISGFSLRPCDSDQEFGENLLQSEDPWVDGGEAFFLLEDGSDESVAEGSYDVRVTCMDGSFFELQGLLFERGGYVDVAYGKDIDSGMTDEERKRADEMAALDDEADRMMG